METKDIKQISIVDFLHRNGIDSKRVSGGNSLYNAPYRDDKTPSFSVNSNNRWYDFATGEKGDIIDLAQKIENCDFMSAKRILEQGSGVEKRKFEGNVIKTKVENSVISILRESNVVSPALTQYLKERKIDVNIAKKYCKELYYSVNSKRYFALAFKNDTGGYEIRNKFFKGCVKSKDITTFRGNNEGCLVFEGFIDFLSYMTINKVETFKGSVVVLNSIVNIDKAKEFICSHTKVNCYLDNDKGGKDTVEKIKSWGASQREVRDMSYKYKDCKDVNEFLMGLESNKSVKNISLKNSIR